METSRSCGSVLRRHVSPRERESGTHSEVHKGDTSRDKEHSCHGDPFVVTVALRSINKSNSNPPPASGTMNAILMPRASWL